VSSISDIEKKLVQLDKELHSILKTLREMKGGEGKEDLVEQTAGAWGYDVDSVEFVRKLRRSSRVGRLI